MGPGLLLCRLLLGFALPLFSSVREALEAPSGTAHKEHPLRVLIFLLLSLMPVIPMSPYILASSALSPLPAHVAILEQSPPHVSVFSNSSLFLIRSSSSFVSFRSFIVSFVWTSSSTLARFGGIAALSCELDEAASLVVS